MPDISRRDSQRSDTSLRPRVSFNRDVHVKRIVPRDGPRIVDAPGSDVANHLIVAPIRKQRLSKSKEELVEEATKVLAQADKLECVVRDKGLPPEKFNTLPNRKKHKDYSASLDRRVKRKGSLELLPPKKPPRIFAGSPPPRNTQKTSIFDIFKKSEKKTEPKKSNLRRSVSDASHGKSKPTVEFSTNSLRKKQEAPVGKKKPLSPIIEVTPREDYFSTVDENNKENKEPKSVTEQLKQYIDEVDAALYKETGIRISKDPEPIIIDVDKAEKISTKKSKFKTSSIGKKLKSITNKKNKTNDSPEAKHHDQGNPFEDTLNPETGLSKSSVAPTIQAAIQVLETPERRSPEMIHSSQKPAEKLPLTKGRTVNTMVKQLSYDSCSSPPPRSNVLISPNVSVQHNNNQPFSYTRGLSPEKTPATPIIYAQVVCGNGTGTGKQTIHTAYKKQPNSDSDEGLGGEESLGFAKNTTRFYGEKFEEESPILPKFRNATPTFLNGFSENQNEANGGYVDSSSRGRGDGMDAKRRESLTEPHDNGVRTDLSARRDLLESRIHRRINDKSLRTSPDDGSPTNVYITQTSSKYYRSGSNSPVGYKEKYVSETRTKKKYNYNGFDNEPKSFDSQISDYRSSPENRHFDSSQSNKYHKQHILYKDKSYYKSTPEIHQARYNDHESYHDSLRRDKTENRLTNTSRYKSERYLDQYEHERKDRFGDSGIENDFRRDSSEHCRTNRPARTRPDFCNESEDEGFASSLLITSERQHTEDNFGRGKLLKDYDSDRTYSKEDESYRNLEGMEYRKYGVRERSIDDGSHYDPRIDGRSTLKRTEKKPPKPEKKSGLEKVKALFTSRKKKEKHPPMVREDSLRARYVEYKGKETKEDKMRKNQTKEVYKGLDYPDRRRLSTPSPSPTPETHRNGKSETTHGSWFKSLDRISRKKSSKDDRDGNFTSTEDETPTKPTPMKNLRFFGDTDVESNDSIRYKSALKSRSGIPYRTRSQSTRNLHNISEELRTPEVNSHRKASHKSMTNLSEAKDPRINSKPPISPSHRPREVTPKRDDRNRRRKNDGVSSVESSTEGDSSQQSQRSIVYLHAATVGDIPGPGYRNGRRAASREELASNSSSRIQPQVKTLSRSFSVLAPWKPHHKEEGMDIDYTQHSKPTKNGKYEQKYNKSSSRKDNSSTLKKKAQESRKNSSTLNRRSRSKENLSSQNLRRSKEEISKGSTSTLYKKKERLPRENSRYNRDREDKRISSKSLSVESLGGGRNARKTRDENGRDISRSMSMPRDPEKSAGWFRMKRSEVSNSTQRL